MDALIAPTLERPLTINGQLELIRISSLSGKPLLTLDSPANANLMQMGARALSQVADHMV